LPALTIDLQDEGPPPVLLLGGALDAATRLRLREVVLPGLRNDWDDVVLDLAWLGYLDSQGTETLIELARAARGSVLLRGAHGLPFHVLESIDRRSVPANLVFDGISARPVDAPPRVGAIPIARGLRSVARRSPPVHGPVPHRSEAEGTPGRTARSA